MPFPYFIRKLFQNDGAGDKLNPRIIPTTVNGVAADASGNIEVKNSKTIGALSYAEYQQLDFDHIEIAQKNAGLRIGIKAEITRPTTVAELKQAILDAIAANQRNYANLTLSFLVSGVADNWDNNSANISGGSLWTVTALMSTTPTTNGYGCFRLATYTSEYFFYVAGGTISKLYRPMYKENAVTSGTSGTMWYRKHPDGWIEQGGYYAAGTASVTFPTAFKDASKITVVTGTHLGVNSSMTFGVDSVSTTGFTSPKKNQSGTRNDKNVSSWYACGY